MPSAIDPSQIPGDNLDPDTVDESADQMRTIGVAIVNQGSKVLTSWQAITASYEAPESSTLLSVMDPVSTDSDQFGANLGKVASALNAYADAVRPIKAELASLKIQATAFVNGIQGGITHTTYSHAGPITSNESWDEDQASVDKNNDLINRVNAQMVLLWAAERDCANKINDTIGRSPIEAANQTNPSGYGVDSIPNGTNMPWGDDVQRTEGCGEKAADSVGHFVWNGVIVNGLWGTVKGIGTLALGYNPSDGSFFHSSTYGQAWSNIGMLGAGFISMLSGGTASAASGPIGTFMRNGRDTLLATGKSMIAYDEWSTDPATAAGTSVFNVGTIVLPGGAELDGVKAGTSAATAALRGAGKVAEMVDPISALYKVGATGLKVAMPTITDLTKSIAASLHFGDIGDLDKLNLPKIEIPAGSDHGFDFNSGKGTDTELLPTSAADVPHSDIPPIHSGGHGSLGTMHVRENDLMPAGPRSSDSGTTAEEIHSTSPTHRESFPVATLTTDDEISAGEHVRSVATFNHTDQSPNVGDHTSPPQSYTRNAAEDVQTPDRLQFHAPDAVRASGTIPAHFHSSENDVGAVAPATNATEGGDSPFTDETVTGMPHQLDSDYGHDAERTGKDDPTFRGDIAPGEPVIHAQFDSADKLKTMMRQWYPQLAKVNHLHWKIRVGNVSAGDFGAVTRSTYSTQAAVATDDVLRGDPSTLLYLDDHDGHQWMVLNAHGHLPRYVEAKPTFESVAETMMARPIGSQGIVFLTTPRDTGLAFNVIHDQHGVVFIDGQTRQFANLQGHQNLSLLITDGTDLHDVDLIENFSESRSSSIDFPTYNGELDNGFSVRNEAPSMYLEPSDGEFPQFRGELGGDYPTFRGDLIRDLATPVPGHRPYLNAELAEPPRTAIHSGSASSDIFYSVMAHEYPSMAHVNTPGPDESPLGRRTNCTRCVIATDETLGGVPTNAEPLYDPRGDLWNYVADHFDKNVMDFQPQESFVDIVRTMESLPVGSRAVVWGTRKQGIGHTFNVVHDRNGVVFIDGQTGRFATLEPYMFLHLLITKVA